MRLYTAAFALFVAFAPWRASAQWGAGAPEAPSAQAPPPYESAAGPDLPLYALTNANLGVPLLLDSDRSVVRPGASLDGRFVLSGVYFGAGFHGGFQWVPLDLESSRQVPRSGGEGPLRRGFFGPFAHAQIPTPSGFVPYAQAGFDFNFWSSGESTLVCDLWSCVGTQVYRFAPGLHGRLGGRFPVTVDRSLHLDVGLELGTSFPGNFFYERQPWLTPFVGLTHSN